MDRETELNEVKRKLINQYMVKVGLTENIKDDVTVGLGSIFHIENEELNLLDFYYFCFDVVGGIVDKSLMLIHSPEIHKSFEEPIDDKYLMHEINKYREMLLLMIIEKNNRFNELNKLTDTDQENENKD